LPENLRVFPGNIVTRGIDTVFRLVGLRVGRKATQVAPGQGQGLAEPMMIADEFSAFLNVPKMKHRDLLLRAVEDPDFFKLLMEKGGEGGPRSVRLRNRLNAYLYDAGFVGATDYEREKQRREFDPRELRNMPRQTVRPPVAIPQQRLQEQNLRNAPPNLPPPNQQGALVPPVQTPTLDRGAAPRPVQQASAAPQRPPIQSSGPVDRTRYAALFPEDRELLGIGSLMGR
jgi:hypothetical protein